MKKLIDFENHRTFIEFKFIIFFLIFAWKLILRILKNEALLQWNFPCLSNQLKVYLGVLKYSSTY